MDVIEWLLEPENPSIRYLTLLYLLDRDEESLEVREASRRIPDSEPVQKLLGAMHPEGYWLQKNEQTGLFTGDGTEYGCFASTHFCLSYCSELGLNRNHPLVDRAAQRYLGLQKEDGDWLGHYSCLYAYNIRTFVRLGYRNDERVQKAINLMLGTDRSDGGYLCDIHEKGKGRPKKSCIRGSVKALLAFAELPEYWQHERCLRLVEYFLKRNGIYRSKDLHSFTNKDMERDTFPIIWRTNVWEVLYALAKMGYGNDPGLSGAWQVLAERADSTGRYVLNWTPMQSPWKVGRTGEPNKWITLYCLLAEKYRS